MTKLLTTCLLLSKDQPADKVPFLFELYSNLCSTVMKRHNIKQMLDHITFIVIFAIPELAYYVPEIGGINTPEFKRIMEIKLEMQKKVRTFFLFNQLRFTMINQTCTNV